MSSEFDKKKMAHILGGGKEKQDQQRRKGKLTAFERADAIFDPGTFIEIDPFVVHDCKDFGLENKKIFGDGVITGYGLIDGRLVYSFLHDFTVFGGSLGLAFASKVCKIMDLAINVFLLKVVRALRLISL